MFPIVLTRPLWLCVPVWLAMMMAALPAAESRPARPARTLVVLIGGVDSDPTPAQIDGTAGRDEGNSGLYRFAGDVAGAGLQAEYFNWNGTRAGRINAAQPPRARGVADFIAGHLQEHPGDRVALVGNSWGGHTALEAAELLSQPPAPLAIHLAVFLDPSSTGRGPARPKGLPVNVNRAVSYCTRNAFVWGPWDAGPRLKNIDLGNPARGFMQNGTPPYDAAFNLQAHVRAEWDEQIHRDMLRRILALSNRDER